MAKKKQRKLLILKEDSKKEYDKSVKKAEKFFDKYEKNLNKLFEDYRKLPPQSRIFAYKQMLGVLNKFKPGPDTIHTYFG